MNLSKGEKLLAAKKKLKEFQLNKMLQDGSAKEKHIINSSPAQCQNAEFNKLNIQVVNNIPAIKPSDNNAHMYDQNFQKNERITQDVITAENIISHEEQKCIKETIKHVQDIDKINSKPEPEKKMDLNDFPKVQKEHLLEMASAVAEVLTNDLEHAEVSLDCDLVCRNQFLSSYIEEQKKIVNELHVELSNAHSRISELETKLNAKEKDFQMHLAREINPLQEQLQIHTQTTGILIAEKAELTAALSQAQQSVRESTEETEEMIGKLKKSQTRIVELEKEMSTMKNSNKELEKNIHQLQNKYESLDNTCLELKKENKDLNWQVSELSNNLYSKRMELHAVQQELEEKAALLSLSELRILQMKGSTPTEEEKHTTVLLEQELTQTKESLKALNTEKDEANKQYQNYVKQLDAQQTKLLDEIKTQKTTIEALQQREQSYVQTLSELEQQLQQEKGKVENLSSLHGDKNQVDDLLKNVDELTLEQERLHIALSEKDFQIETLMKDINLLRETSNQEAEVSKLANALESEQLGASRAVNQNRQLKEQLTDMENAFVSLSNAKLDLTEQLQAERSIGRKLNAQLNNVENELEDIKEKLKEKEAILEEFKKENLLNAQIANQTQHYRIQSHHPNTFQEELQSALITIEKLEKEKLQLIEKLNEKNQGSIILETNSTNGKSNVLSQEENGRAAELIESSAIAVEPVKQLEQRFKETMERVVELTEEKQKLEHLVLQLQSETETIGEYIALYQKQRAVLQNRTREKEQVYRQILDQRNQQQEQLHKLKILVSDFLRKEYIHSSEAERLSERATDCNDVVVLKKKDEDSDRQKNVSALLEALTEIKECKESSMFEPNFHPCPWCSGKLFTV